MLHLRRLVALTLAVFLLTTASATAGDIENTELGFGFWAPDGWEQESDEDSFTMSSPDGVSVVFIDVPADSLETAAEAMATELLKGIDIKARLRHPKKDQLKERLQISG